MANSTQTSSTSKSTSMADLLAKNKSQFVTYRKGDNIEGVITKLTSSEILVDIGAKTEATVLEKDKNILHSLLGSLKVGDKVSVSILNPESDQGNPIVSLRRFLDERVWGELERLKNDAEVLEVTVNEITKGGFLASSERGISGFLPNSQAILTDNPQSFVGKKIKVVVLEAVRIQHKIIFSQKTAMGEGDFQKALGNLKTGDKVDVVVTNSTTFGIFVSIQNQGDNLEGFIHISEISWDKIETAEGIYPQGERIEAQVIEIDKDTRRINLSIKRLTQDPFAEKMKNFSVDKKVTGNVTQVSSMGVTIDLGDGVEGLIKKDKIPATLSFEVGSEVTATVSEVDSRKHRLILLPVLLEKPLGYR